MDVSDSPRGCTAAVGASCHQTPGLRTSTPDSGPCKWSTSPRQAWSGLNSPPVEIKIKLNTTASHLSDLNSLMTVDSMVLGTVRASEAALCVLYAHPLLHHHNSDEQLSALRLSHPWEAGGTVVKMLAGCRPAPTEGQEEGKVSSSSALGPALLGTKLCSSAIKYQSPLPSSFLSSCFLL
ncbi:Immunoglobulin-Like Domain-Containing Receptor 1 [Manis pentadactyla]|nr:Immunoglobulin-Like Domain-Containing Receptor 1 [Manis pentadactyla]